MRGIEGGKRQKIRLPGQDGRINVIQRNIQYRPMTDDDVQQPRSSWPYGIALPHRYSSHYGQYRALGGLVDVTDDARAYAGPEPLRDLERFLALSLAFDQIHKEGVAGDFAELGVYKGDTAAVLARHARRLGLALAQFRLIQRRISHEILEKIG